MFFFIIFGSDLCPTCPSRGGHEGYLRFQMDPLEFRTKRMPLIWNRCGTPWNYTKGTPGSRSKNLSRGSKFKVLERVPYGYIFMLYQAIHDT